MYLNMFIFSSKYKPTFWVFTIITELKTISPGFLLSKDVSFYVNKNYKLKFTIVPLKAA